jgi:hypothetical protein
MGKKVKKLEEKPKGPVKKPKLELPFGRRNYIWFGIGILVIVIGYLLLGLGDITLAPILLVAGYCVIIPISIIMSGEKKKKAENAQPEKQSLQPKQTSQS